MSELNNSDYFSRKRQKNRSVLRVLPTTTSNKTKKIGGEGLYKGTPKDLTHVEKERQKKLEKIKPYLLGMMKNCEQVEQQIKATKLFTQEHKPEEEYFSLLDTLITQYSGNIKTSILTDKLTEFKELIQQVSIAYKSLTQHINDTPLEALQLIVAKRNFPHINTLKKSFSAVYLAKEMYDHTLKDPFWNKELVDEEAVSVLSGAIYYSSIYDGLEQEKALENVIEALQDEFGFAINREIALDYVKNTVYSKYRPKK